LLVGFSALPLFGPETIPLELIPALDAVIFVTTFITAILLTVQFTMTRARPILVLACGFLFSCILDVVHEWSTRLADANSTETTRALYSWWIFVVPVTVFIYARLRVAERAVISSRTPTATYTVVGVMGVVALTGCVAWLTSGFAPQPFWAETLELLLAVAAFLSLRVARRSAFDQWIMLVLIGLAISQVMIIIPNLALHIRELQGQHGTGMDPLIDPYHPTPIGFYAIKVSSAISSTLLLAALIAETARLYTEVARVNALTSTVSVSQALSGEIALPNLIERLMTVVLRYSGADRGLLILPRENDHVVAAEVRAQGEGVSLHCDPSDSPPLPKLVISHVSRTKAPVVLDDAARQILFSEDPYLKIHSPRSILCLPLVRQGVLSGTIYLENTLAPNVFTSERVRMLELLASQAAISLDNARLYANLDLQVGILQQLPVSAWTLKPDGTPDFVNQVWLEFAGQTLDFVRSHPEAWMTAVHPDDRDMAANSFWEGVHSGQGFAMEIRSLRAQDGTYRWHLNQAVVLRDSDGKVLKFVGTATDIDDQKRIEEALRQAQGDLARINRVTTMGELAGSLAHELSQPICGALANANACLRWLERDKPDLDKARASVTSITGDAKRAAQIIDGIRAQFQKGSLHREVIDVNEINRETIALLRDEAVRYKVSVRTELADDLPQVVGNRVQLQQVAMNLIVNSMEAMKDVDGIREIVIKSRQDENEQILVSFSDTGIGLPPQLAEQIFDPFVTTKPNGTGMGLRISRSIIESHGGRLWTVGTSGRGAIFQFTLPAAALQDAHRLSSPDRGREMS
jgi:PAS domain S-box-containing protein